MTELMASILFDTNALVYWVYTDSPKHAEVTKLLTASFLKNASVFALTSSLNDVYYALRRHSMCEADAREAIRDIAETFDLVDLTGILVFASLDSSEPDYEDGVVRAAAESLQVDVIVTYDQKAFSDSFIPCMTADQALTELFPAE